MNKLYANLQDEYKKLRLQLLTLTCIVRRIQDDEHDSQVRIEKLAMARVFLIDKIHALEESLEELKAKSHQSSERTEGSDAGSDHATQGTESEDPLSKDARIKAVRFAVERLKNHLAWGRYMGTTDELDESFREVMELL